MVQAASSNFDRDVEFECHRRQALLLSTNDQQRVAERFRDRILKLGLFHIDEIEMMHEPTKVGLENKLKYLEAQIEEYGKRHSQNTFVTVYYCGQAQMRDRHLEITLYEEQNSRNLI